MNNFPKILIAAPTAKAKNYIFEEWLGNVMNFTYPNFEVRLFDNTQDGGVNAKSLNDFYTSRYGDNDKFKCINSLMLNKVKKVESVIEKMVISHQDCADYSLKNNFDFLFHLETDVLPPTDVIEQLLFHKKQVIGAVYHLDEGISRKAMIQTLQYNERQVIGLNLEPHQDDYLDGTVKKVFSVGLGCVLISNKVLKKIKFRSVKNDNHHPDSFFCEDCFSNNISIFAHTGLIAAHENKAWGIYGLDFK